jgi:hypothetical protein
VFLHEHTQGVVRVITIRSPAFIAGGGIQSQEFLGDAVPSAARTYIDAFKFAKFRVEHYRPKSLIFKRRYIGND